MQTLLIECVVRTSLIAAVVGLVLSGMRIKTASARHAVWTGVVLVMLVLPAFLIWGPRASLPVLPRGLGQTAITIVPVANGPASTPIQVRVAGAAPQRSVWSWPAFFAGVYLLGLCTLVLRLAIGTVRVRWLLGGAVVRDGRLTHASCSTPITVGWIRPSVILPVDWSAWPQARLDAILMHEHEHARRRDPLFQWIALLNRALFWFHPLAWWLERRLSELAEEACDTAVLARGYDPRDYSETLLDLARSVERAGKRIDALGMTMPGAFLPHRIRRMLSGAPVPRISRSRMMCTAVVCAAAVVILAAGSLVHAQSKSQPGPTFEVASVRPSDPGGPGVGKKQGGGGGGIGRQTDHGRFRWDESLYGFILRAYGLQGCGVMVHDPARCASLSGGPAWVNEDRFEIQAKTPDGTPDYTPAQFNGGHAPQLQLMLQALLAARFNLKLHREKKQLPVYALTIGKNGPRLKRGAETEQPALMFSAGTPGNTSPVIQLIAKNESMQDLADTFSGILGRPILDRTGLKGKFDFTMAYDRDPDPTDTPMPAAELGGPSFFAALTKQAGLKLESTKGPVEVLVIDHADKPSEN